MNTMAAAKSMVAARRNVSFGDMMGGSFFVKNDPMIAPQKDGNYTIVRVYRGQDEKMTDLDAAAAVSLLADWIGAVALDMPTPKVEGQWRARLAEMGYE